MALVTRSLPVALLATCRFVNTEAKPILAPKFAALRNELTHFIIDSASFVSFTDEDDSITQQAARYQHGYRYPESSVALGGKILPEDTSAYFAVCNFVEKCAEYRCNGLWGKDITCAMCVVLVHLPPLHEHVPYRYTSEIRHINRPYL
jgi:hypothetical protein